MSDDSLFGTPSSPPDERLTDRPTDHQTDRAATETVDLPTLVAGDRVQHTFLVLDRSEKAMASGDTFIVLTLGNASGSIDTSPLWPERRAWADGVQKGSVVQAIGDISMYTRGTSVKRQLTLTAPLRVLPAEYADPAQFLPSVGDCTKLWDWIDRQRAELQSVTLRRIVDLFFADDAFRLRFERTPGASPRGHHAKLGGLLLHTFEVASVARHSARTMRANVDLVVTGALLHDIGKVEAYDVSPSGFGVTPVGVVIGHVTQGALMLERALAARAVSGEPLCTPEQQIELIHMILSHHGSLEFGSPVQPMTLEAEIVHWADEMSSKANDMGECLDDQDLFLGNGQISDGKPWRVGRRIWRRPHGWE